MKTVFSVVDWCGWVQDKPGKGKSDPADSPLLTSEVPDVDIIPPLLRRRLNLLGRAAASQMLRLLEDNTNIPVVYCSRHGDIERTLSVLQELAAGESVSPAYFSLSVHNAVPGLISIQQGITANISSIAAGDEPLVPCLLEAAGILSPQQPLVLCLFADVRLPEIYHRAHHVPQSTYACGFVLGLKGGQRLSLTMTENSTPLNNSQPIALEFIHFLNGSTSTLNVRHNGSPWTLCKL